MSLDYNKISAVLGDTAQLAVFVHLLDKKDDYLSGIAEATGLSHSSIARVAMPLVCAGVFTESKFGKQIRVFKLNEDSIITIEARKFFEILSEQ